MTNEVVHVAARVAFQAHYGQTRSDGVTPYIVHPLSTMRMVARYTKDPEVLAAAVLHDVVEDTPITLQTIADDFGSRVSDIVGEVTIPLGLIIPEKRTERQIWQVSHLADMGNASILVKICDRMDNIRDLVGSTFSVRRQRDYAAHTQEFVLAAEKVLASQTPVPEPIINALWSLKIALLAVQQDLAEEPFPY